MDDFVTVAAACGPSVKEAVWDRLAAPAQCFRGSFTEQLTILTGKPAKVHEPPTARNHRYRDRVRRVSGEFCVHPVQPKPPQINHRRRLAAPLKRPLHGSCADPGCLCQFASAPWCFRVRVHQIDRPLRDSWARRDFAFSQSLGVIVGLYLQQALDQQMLQVPHGELVVEKPTGLPDLTCQEPD
jgi:hypothetical protein